MKGRKGRYYLGRVVKSGCMDQDKLIEALRNPVVVEKGKYKWTIVDIQEGIVGKSSYVFGNLAKYEDTGTVPIVEETERAQYELPVPGLLVAKSPFVYFRDFSGIAYMHVWNSIEEQAFRRRFARIVCKKYDDFFVDCAIEAITDLRTFVNKVESLNVIFEIKARVQPPNPLFGICWKPLHDYITERNATSVSVKEESSPGKGGLKTQLQEIIRKVLREEFSTLLKPSMTDAALLMATDGYGRGQVVGVDADNAQVVVRTSDTQKSFLFEKEPVAQSLAEHVYQMLEHVSLERKMSHAGN